LFETIVNHGAARAGHRIADKEDFHE
jgi:hypothetical protein